MATYLQSVKENPVLAGLGFISHFFLRPVRLIQNYDRSNLRPDLIAGLTVAVILLPQGIAFALIAELPPQMGLYAAIVGGIVGALWGSSNQIHTGPTNAISLLVFSALAGVSATGTSDYIIAAGMMAVMAGVFQLVMGVARLGILVNFVSHSVIVGFSSGAGVLIVINQIQRVLGLEFERHGHSVLGTIQGIITHVLETHGPTAALGIGTIILIVVLRKVNPKLPSALISMIAASIVVYLIGLHEAGVAVIGQLPTELPPLARLPLFNLDFIARLSTGALAVGAIGLVETTAISRSIAAQTGQRLDNNQEFVGQGLANLTAGLFSGYAGAGSFSRSAVNFKAGAETPLSAVFSGLFVLIAMFALAPFAAFLPRTALAGVLIVIGFGMIDRAEIRRIWRGTRGDALIMLVTFAGTLFLPIEFAVLAGILLSFAYYIMRTSVPRVYPVLPDEKFKHFIQQQADQRPCPQLGIIKISGDLYFGAVNHVEEALLEHLDAHPHQRFLLLRMHGVNQCDFSGIHMLETIHHSCLERGGDLYLMKVQKPVEAVMRSTGFYDKMGADHFLSEDQAIDYLFHKILDPAICIYECNVRAFAECQNLPKRTFEGELPLFTETSTEKIDGISPDELRKKLLTAAIQPLVIDVREPREFKRGHIPDAQLLPLSQILTNGSDLPADQEMIIVCRSGRRSTRAAQILVRNGCEKIKVLQGGMIAWETAGLLEAVDQ